MFQFYREYENFWEILGMLAYDILTTKLNASYLTQWKHHIDIHVGFYYS